MKIYEILDIITEIKKQRKRTYHNYYNKYDKSEDDMSVVQRDGTIVFVVKEEFVNRVFFFTNNLEELSECFRKLDGKYVMDYVCKAEENLLEGCFLDGGWKYYSTYLRNSMTVEYMMNKEPKTKIEKIMAERYDPDIGKPAEYSDIPALRKLMIEVFDPINSEILSEEELKHMIDDETVWVYKEDGEICTAYAFRIEGKKRYGAMTYNNLSADYLHSLCKNAHLASQEKHDLQVHYGWVRYDNAGILRTLEKSSTLFLDGVRNYIYTMGY